jgi:hypothetical protein
VVAYIAKLRRKSKGGERLSFAVIAERLNAESVPTRTGKAWGRQRRCEGSCCAVSGTVRAAGNQWFLLLLPLCFPMASPVNRPKIV